MPKNISPDTRCCVVTWLEGVKINNSSIFESDLGFRGEGLVSNPKKVLYLATYSSEVYWSVNHKAPGEYLEDGV